MSKRDLKKYLQELDKSQLEEQIVALYEKFSAIKVYYDFVFNPREEIIVNEAKIKIANEYFPVRTSGKPRRPKMRRSVAQKYIKHFMLLGVDVFLIADLMLYAIEIGQTFTAEKPVKSELFYKSMLQSFEQLVRFLIANGILTHFHTRMQAVIDEVFRQNWINTVEFEAIMERLAY